MTAEIPTGEIQPGRFAFPPRTELLDGNFRVGERVASRVWDLLNRYQRHVPFATANLIAQSESERALQAHRERRIAGEANDFSSHEPGLIVLITQQGFRRIVARCDSLQLPIQEDQIAVIDKDLVAVRLPTAIYNDTDGIILFLEPGQKGTYEDHKKPVNLKWKDVLRVETDHNELWQNDTRNWDGTPKETSST